ncbi:uncharacterized protein KRP23_11197 [Phytophthora ramorum]|uniref:uncharacterized protein n=1 Tax=Phytophthora ramorum TaxID=164328 RepID=UPI0030A674F4|nr:hypothetical protein KRP23_11197 [Phytophthora ramorum]
MTPAHERVVPVPSPLDFVAPAPFLPPPDFPTLCQICLDAPACVFQLCGVECLAEVCECCLVRHLSASVYSFYPGVLPKVRCPVCLTLLNKNQWEKFVLPPKQTTQEQVEQDQEEQNQEQEDPQFVDDNAHVLDKYVVLCRQSCGFQSPCCHNADYTMLPERYSDSDDEEEELALPLEQIQALPELQQRGVEFCYHREDTPTFYEFLTKTFEEKAEDVLWTLLPKIVDEERRAALLLRHLTKNPDTQTRCCAADVCFKCKATNHHEGKCRDFIEDQNVVECRGCGVTVVMVDGCDALRCLCGYSFSWSDEVARQRAQRKGLAPTENAEYNHWLRWQRHMYGSLQKVANMSATKRELRLARLIREHRSLLRQVLLPRVYRLRLGKKDPVSVTEAMVKLRSMAESPAGPESPLLSRSESAP